MSIYIKNLDMTIDNKIDVRRDIMDSRVNVTIRKIIEAIEDLNTGDAILILEQIKFDRQMTAWEKNR